MQMRNVATAALAGIVLLVPASTRAQAPATPPAAAAAGDAKGPPKPPPKLVFDREVYDYPGSARRDPFRPLLDSDKAGPQFTELTLTGIVIAPNPAQSFATFHDMSKKEYRVRRGESIGNATVQDITRTRVVFSITEFGMRRQEVMELKLPGGGA